MGPCTFLQLARLLSINACRLTLMCVCISAMLTVEDEAFWEGLAPVTFGQLPRLQDQVTVIGYAQRLSHDQETKAHIFMYSQRLP